jgi:hypothetical protein
MHSLSCSLDLERSFVPWAESSLVWDLDEHESMATDQNAITTSLLRLSLSKLDGGQEGINQTSGIEFYENVWDWELSVQQLA